MLQYIYFGSHSVCNFAFVSYCVILREMWRNKKNIYTVYKYIPPSLRFRQTATDGKTGIWTVDVKLRCVSPTTSTLVTASVVLPAL